MSRSQKYTWYVAYAFAAPETFMLSESIRSQLNGLHVVTVYSCGMGPLFRVEKNIHVALRLFPHVISCYRGASFRQIQKYILRYFHSSTVHVALL